MVVKNTNLKKRIKTTRKSNRTTKIIDLSHIADNAFRIEQGSSYLTGFHSNCDFTREKSKRTRGEIFYVEVDQKRTGIGTNLCIEALNFMKNNGVTTVTMNPVTNEGKKLIESLIKRGFISKPIKVSETGKMEFLIL
jgi:hypothetical protein